MKYRPYSKMPNRNNSTIGSTRAVSTVAAPRRQGCFGILSDLVGQLATDRDPGIVRRQPVGRNREGGCAGDRAHRAELEAAIGIAGWNRDGHAIVIERPGI